METRPGFLSRVTDAVFGKAPFAPEPTVTLTEELVVPHKESFAEMAARLQKGARNPQRWANLGGKWVPWTDKYSIQRYVTDLEKKVKVEAK